MSWQSAPIAIDGITIDIKADASGIDFGKTVDGVYASDLHLAPEDALAIADALQEAVIQCRSMRAAE